MKFIQNIGTILVLMILMVVPISAQESTTDLPNPGITPDSPFYFLDKAFDVFQSKESIANERAAEVIAMAKKSHEKGLTIALEGYEKAIANRQKEAEKNEGEAERVALQISNHLGVLARVREQVPEQAKFGIDMAINKSAQGREDALATLREKNPEKARLVAESTLLEIISKAPVEALPGLQQALESVISKGNNSEGEENKPEDIGKLNIETPNQNP